MLAHHHFSGPEPLVYAHDYIADFVPEVYHPHDGHLMSHDELDFYLTTDPHDMTLEQLSIFSKMKSGFKNMGSKIKSTAQKAGTGAKKWWGNNKYKVKKGINIADKVTGAVDTVASMGGAAVCGPYAGACKAGAMGAHMATSVAAAAANRYIKMQMLQAQMEAQQMADMGLIY